MRITIPTFAQRLRYLMNRDGIKNAPHLAAAMYERHIIEYPDSINETRCKECCANATRTIDLHLHGKAIENISGEWIKRYSTFFACSTDYLFGLISQPTPDVASVHDVTGLSEEAIIKLMSIKDDPSADVLSSIITDRELIYVLRSIDTLIKTDLDSAFIDSVRAYYAARFDNTNIELPYMDDPDALKAVFEHRPTRHFERIVDRLTDPKAK